MCETSLTIIILLADIALLLSMQLLDDSGQIKQNLTFQGLLNAMKEPWIFKQRFPRQGLILRSLESTRRISSRVARRHGIQTQGVAQEGGSYF